MFELPASFHIITSPSFILMYLILTHFVRFLIRTNDNVTVYCILKI